MATVDLFAIIGFSALLVGVSILMTFILFKLSANEGK
ncbi:hypothetical protein SAMN04488123_11525 [Natribacillus halophilus]|uniref:Uncharacterized protein n=1 Tax=Natribacillus halophilus TaxID=549003 RepID=A0A1G8R2H4_9BACI|nr:hypothetical protein SAMN04488123_11525 [Natribacillus halophilus]